MLDKTSNKVHLMYLLFLTNMCRTRQYSWIYAYYIGNYAGQQKPHKKQWVVVHRFYNCWHGIACPTSHLFPLNNLCTPYFVDGVAV